MDGSVLEGLSNNNIPTLPGYLFNRKTGRAAAFLDASPILWHNHFANNEGGWRGGGAINIGLNSTPQLKENPFTQNKAPQGKDIWVSADSSLQEDFQDSLQNIDIFKQEKGAVNRYPATRITVYLSSYDFFNSVIIL